MKLLLDTNALIWWMEDEPSLGSRARAHLADPANIVIGTLVSIWEITLKWRSGKYPTPGAAYMQFLDEEGIDILPIDAAHVAALDTLDMHHKDPFDHLIIAQAMVEGATIVTSDRDMTLYGVPCMPAMR
jgi:PIN domain nuclease of toxin-antitoxin system